MPRASSRSWPWSPGWHWCSIAPSDAVSTLVTTRRRPGRFWPTPVFYGRPGAPGWPSPAGPPRSSARDSWAATARCPCSACWRSGCCCWSWAGAPSGGGLRSRVSGVDDYIDAVYFAGVGFLTVGFGDILPTGDLARLLVLVEAFMGLVTMALVIGYLPTLYGAYSRREVQLLALDDLSEEDITPVTFLEASPCRRRGRGGGGDVRRLGAVVRRGVRQPQRLPHAGPVPLPAARPALADRARGGDGRRRHLRGHDRRVPGTGPRRDCCGGAPCW
jgi:hypothetical protein